jgi:SAM-dependent methyltransferase
VAARPLEPDRVFGEVADEYDRRRPDYPAEVVDAVLAAAPEPWRVLESGAGTGKATALFAARGIPIVAVEPDALMAALLVARGADAGADVTVTIARLEDYEPEPGGFSIGLAAQSWHWVDPDRGPAVMARALRPGGVLALVWNTPGDDRSDIRLAIEAAYARHAPELVESSVVNRPRAVADMLRQAFAGGDWNGPDRVVVPWVRRYTSQEYVELIDTHSDHRTLDDDVRTALLEGVRTAIDEHGGAIDYPYDTQLVLLRRA